MQARKQVQLLRIFVGEAKQLDDTPFYEAVVLKAREMHMAGTTVLRGSVGYGHSSHLHTSKILRLSDDLPLVIEIVDSAEKIDALLPVLDAMFTESGGSGLMTLQNLEALQYGAQTAS